MGNKTKKAKNVENNQKKPKATTSQEGASGSRTTPVDTAQQSRNNQPPRDQSSRDIQGGSQQRMNSSRDQSSRDIQGGNQQRVNSPMDHQGYTQQRDHYDSYYQRDHYQRDRNGNNQSQRDHREQSPWGSQRGSYPLDQSNRDIHGSNNNYNGDYREPPRNRGRSRDRRGSQGYRSREPSYSREPSRQRQRSDSRHSGNYTRSPNENYRQEPYRPEYGRS